MIITPPIPTRSIASRSAVIPLLVTFPFSQNQNTHGRADGGGRTKFFSKSPALPKTATANNPKQINVLIVLVLSSSSFSSTLSFTFVVHFVVSPLTLPIEIQI